MASKAEQRRQEVANDVIGVQTAAVAKMFLALKAVEQDEARGFGLTPTTRQMVTEALAFIDGEVVPTRQMGGL